MMCDLVDYSHIHNVVLVYSKVGGNVTNQIRVGLTCNEAATCIVFERQSYVAVFLCSG